MGSDRSTILPTRPCAEPDHFCEIASELDVYKSLFRNAPLGFQSLDAAGNFLFVNQTWLRLLGYAEEEVIGHWFGDFLTPECRETYHRRFSDSIKAGEAHGIELDLIRKDQAIIHVVFDSTLTRDCAGNVVSTQCIMRDVTELTRMEQALRVSEERFLAIFAQSSIGIAIVSRQETVCDSNHALQHFLGYTAEEMNTISLQDLLIPDEDGPETRKESIPPLSEWRGCFPCEKCYRRKDGKKVWGSLTVTLIHDEAGEPQFAVVMIEDITERKIMEDHLQQAQKMETLGHLASGVAHDFNNLLTPIFGYTELLLSESYPIESKLNAVQEIRKAAERAKELVQQLLTFSRKQFFELKAMKLNDVITDCESILRRTIREDIGISLFLEPTLGLIEGDVGKITEMLMNLVVNAQDAMPHGGDIAIETSNVHLDARYALTHPEVTPGHYVLLTISDCGMGMDSEVLAHLFEPFYTTKETGTGLGLAIIYGIMQQHKGSIEVESEPGKGTTFKLYFPRHFADAELPELQLDIKRIAYGGEHIIVAEDNETVLNLVCTILEEHGYTVQGAGSAGECLALFERLETPAHLLLTDIIMQDMNGQQLYDQLAARYAGVKVLFMSGYTDDVIAQQGMLKPGVHYLQKPFTMSDLMSKIRDVLDGADGG